MKPGSHLKDEALRDKEVALILSEDEVNEVFKGVRHKNAIRDALKRAGVLNGATPPKKESKPKATKKKGRK